VWVGDSVRPRLGRRAAISLRWATVAPRSRSGRCCAIMAHLPHTRDNPGFGDRSFYSLLVDRAGPFGDLRGPGIRASDGAHHLLEIRIEAEEVNAALAALPI
jgi:hypothetical protein